MKLVRTTRVTFARSKARLHPYLIHRRNFRLDQRFLAQYRDKRPNFGYNGLGELVYYRTYARSKPNGGKECWQETVERVVNGAFSLKERWFEQNGLEWDNEKADRIAREMYDMIFHMKFLPPGRSLWAMGTAVTEERGLFAALNNCAFVSTADINEEPAAPFCFTMDSSMLGVGVGFDTLGAGKVKVLHPDEDRVLQYQIADSREGWVDSLEVLLGSYLAHDGKARNRAVNFDYSRIRPAGQPIKGFGGTSSGPEPLKELHRMIKHCLKDLDGKPISITAIVDIMNLIGRCVVAGNVRRTAEIAFGDPESEEYVTLKDYSVNPERAEYGWTSNNSVFANLGMSYKSIVDKVCLNGEPGFAWLQNMQEYGRMVDGKNYKDIRARGGNPCLEQTLEPYELCCLVETFPDKHEDLNEFKNTLKLAYLYGKIVTLGHTHWAKSNKVMLRNRRIGCSMSGIAQFISRKGIGELKEWSDQGYQLIQELDAEYSEWFAIPRSIKTTCIKPSGTVSLLAGATPGMHYPESRYYIRRIRLSANSELIGPLRSAGYWIEPSVTDPENTVVISVPIDIGGGIRTSKKVSLWEQMSLAAFLQFYWADNQVSCTVSFCPEKEAEMLEPALDYFQYQLKGISFLPRLPIGAYPQMPYEEIDEEAYRTMSSALKPLDLSGLYKLADSANGFREKDVESSIQNNSYCEQSRLNVDDGVALPGSLLPDSFCDTDMCTAK